VRRFANFSKDSILPYHHEKHSGPKILTSFSHTPVLFISPAFIIFLPIYDTT
jgi:hypothetical protein